MLDKNIRQDLKYLSESYGKSLSMLVREYLRISIDNDMKKRKLKLTGKQLLLKARSLGVNGPGTPTKDQDRYIYGV